MALATVDRFEGDWVLLEQDGRSVRRRREALPPELKEGDVVDLTTGRIDPAATRKAREETERAIAATDRKTGGFDL